MILWTSFLLALALTAVRLWGLVTLKQDLPAASYPLVVQSIDFLLAFAAALFVDRIIRLLYWHRYFQRRWGHDAPALMKDLVTVLILALALSLWLYLELGVAASGLIAASGATAVVVGFALQTMILDWFSGLSIHLDQSYEIGDWLTIHSAELRESIYGRVEGMDWRTTSLRLDDGRRVMIPNRMVTSNPITNHSRPREPKRLLVTVPIEMRASSDRIVRLFLGEAYKVVRTGGLSALPRPDVILTRIDGDAAHYQVRFYAHPDRIHPDVACSIMTRALHEVIRNHRLPTPAQQIELIQPEEKPNDSHSEARAAIERVGLFAKVLSHEQLDALADHFLPTEFAEGAQLIRQGEAGSSMFVFLEGAASVTVTDTAGISTEVAVLAAGDFVGEMSLMTGAPRTATVTALTRLRCFEVTKPPIEALLASSPGLLEGFGRVLTERQMQLNALANRAPPPATLQLDLLSRMRAFFTRAFVHQVGASD